MKTACLILHGFCGTPFEVSSLHDPLKQLGYTVSMPVLPGHGTKVDDIKQYFYRDWLSFARNKLLELRHDHDRVFVAGFSMGGSLALNLAALEKADALATFAAPFFTYTICPWQIPTFKLFALPLLTRLNPYPRYKVASQKSKEIAPFEGYEGVLCLPQIQSIHTAYKRLKKLLPSITCPAFIAQDINDRMVSPYNALEIARRIKSRQKRLVYVSSEEKTTNHHHILTHRDTKDRLVAEVCAFFQSIDTPPPAPVA